MRRSKKEARYLTVLTVQVPDVASLIDMMRYDRCVPYDEDESRKLWRMLGEERGNPEVPEADHIIRLMRYAAADVPAIAGRWASFHCRVLDERNPDDAQLTDAEALELARAK